MYAIKKKISKYFAGTSLQDLQNADRVYFQSIWEKAFHNLLSVFNFQYG